jgi:3-mercaptopyruvate sulfurtransferase SseA
MKTFLRQTLILVSLSCILGYGLKYLKPKPKPLQTATFQQVSEAIGKPDKIIIDARLPEKFQKGHIPQAINLPLLDFETSYKTVAPQLEKKLIIVYCSGIHCPDGAKLGNKLLEKGHTVSLYKEGWEEWASTTGENPNP